MPKNEALGLELRQIIKTDETAGDIIAKAKERRQEIEKDTETEKQRILADAARRREDMEKQVQAEQEAVLRQQKAKAESAFEASRGRIAARLEENRDGWVQEITNRILQG